MAELNQLGLSAWLEGRARNKGLRAAGFDQELYLPWPGGNLPNYGGAAPRLELDAAIRQVAIDAGVDVMEGMRAIDAVMDGDKVAGVVLTTAGSKRSGTETVTIHCLRLIVADGAKSQLGRTLGRKWHRSTAFGVAARGYIKSHRSDDEWISSHLELRGEKNELLSGYGWVFPLGDGEVNVGVGTLATVKRPANVNLRSLLTFYTDQQRDTWQLEGDVRAPWSALLPMGGAVSNVAGANWVLIGDSAGCVNPLNGEGIDYGLETGHLAAQLFADTPANSRMNFTTVWPQILIAHYGAAFSIARRLAGLITVPKLLPTFGPIGMRSQFLMTIALRVMGNLITPEDKDVTARLWNYAGKSSVKLDSRPPFS
jgi:flavin-dependent dehydrogenase